MAFFPSANSLLFFHFVLVCEKNNGKISNIKRMLLNNWGFVFIVFKVLSKLNPREMTLEGVKVKG
jgi:hypothetical protein